MKILMVLTSHDVLGNTGLKTGFWLEEFAAPYFVFRDAGVQLTLASPKGGQPPLDPKSDLPESQTPAQIRFKKNPTAQKALSETVKLADVKSEDYDTVFYVGGHGPMWDLAESRFRSLCSNLSTIPANRSPWSATRPACFVTSPTRARRS
jgi:putative intracellular protease/amidase